MIRINKLTKSINKQKILNELNLDVPNSTIHGIVGKNGAGKSTLINILGGILKYDEGDILIHEDEKLIHTSLQKKQIGCVFEKPLFIEKLTGFEFLLFISSMYDMSELTGIKRANELLQTFELQDQRNKLIENYSKGMKSKLSLATAILHFPKFLFLDEPFDGIDENSILVIIEILKKMKKNGNTIIITSHQKDLLGLICSNISTIENGKIL
jgi:ABC-2 type transport system ATP-binding protein